MINKFAPLFKKYSTLITTGRIDFRDYEMKNFVSSFIGDPELRRSLRRKHTPLTQYPIIGKRFEFIVETYGKQEEHDITVDLQMLLLVLAKRYKQIGKNFCAYVYNCYGYEVSRHIKKYIRNPANIHYKNIEYEDYMITFEESEIEDCFEDKVYEDSYGIPDASWVRGESCSDLFIDLTPEERLFVVKYYMEDYNDRQIAELFSMHINTVNQKRRSGINKIASKLGIDPDRIRRSRKSGKNALLANSL